MILDSSYQSIFTVTALKQNGNADKPSDCADGVQMKTFKYVALVIMMHMMRQFVFSVIWDNTY